MLEIEFGGSRDLFAQQNKLVQVIRYVFEYLMAFLLSCFNLGK
jgi:hypothetical protein